MKYLIATLFLFVGISAFANETPILKTQNFIDRVYKIKTIKEKSFITFHREPVLYEIEQNKTVLSKLEKSQKTQKPVAVTVDPLTRKILEVKGP